MNWIAIHEEILGSKLRGLRKKIGCSEAEALGILTVLWLWARKNADVTGLIGNADKSDIEKVIYPSISQNVNTHKVVDSLIEEGWIDEKEGTLYIHDWYEWQKQWFDFIEKKEKDRARKRREPKEEIPKEEIREEVIEEKTVKEKGPKKVLYADNVKMFSDEKDKLDDKYGEEFTEKLIEELDNYKGASGRKYKSDYRAILNWVVDKCKTKYPTLMKHEDTIQENENPFSEYL